ncbi:MAG TPA: tetratricopeptide repeat protein [Polyangiaceae bacterium]
MRTGPIRVWPPTPAWLLMACLVSSMASSASAQETPAMASEKSRIKPAGERKLSRRERPTYKAKAETRARIEREGRVSLQIPENLRKILEKKIDARIGRNIAQTKQLRLESMQLLDKFIRETPDDAPEMPEALMRMGELEWEDARDRFLLEFKRWERTPGDQRGEPPNPNYSRPRARFLKVLKQYKTFRNYDLALYVDGFLANEEGKFDESLGRFNRILAWFPGSRFTADAHMIRAEYEFTKEFPNYEVAYREYEEVLKHKDSDLYDLALFKSAWTLWRLGRSEEAARRFLIVFKDTEEGRGGRTRSRAELDELQAEALKNLVAVFVEDEKNRAEDMHRFLVKAGGDKFAGRIVRALADAFFEQAHYERGIEAYRLLLKLEPTSPEAYKYALAVAQGHSTMEAWKELENDYRWIVREYTVPGAESGKPKPRPPAWARVQTPQVIERAEQAIEKQIRDDAVSLHAKAQADKVSRAEFQAAAGLYEVYLSRFGKTRYAYEIHYNLAEIYFYRLDDAANAADSYLAAVRLNPRGKLSRDALYNALSALEQARFKELEAAKAAGKKSQESPTDKRLTEAMELYVKTYPNDRDVPELLFRQGKLYYDFEIYDVAVRQWVLLLEKYPNSRYAAGAGELILDSFNKSKDYRNIETWARRLKTAPSFQTPEQQQRLNTLIVQAVFKQGEQLATAGKHDQAAAAYLRAAKEFPKEPRAAQAAVNAEIEARRAGDLATLSAAATLLVNSHRQRPEAAEGVWIAATTYQEVGLFSEAADYHAIIVDSYPRYSHHRDAAYNAVLLRTTVGEHAKAIESGNKYKRHYARDAAADEVTFLMGKAHEKAEKWQDAERLYESYAKSARSASAQIEALVRLATVRIKRNDERGAAAALDRSLSVYKLNRGQLDNDGKYFAAKARYMQGERILAQFSKVKIEGEVKQLKQRLKQKSELLKRAADTFLSTAEMGVAEWTTASLYQIGFTYDSFAKALLNSPPPASLSEEEKELYQQSIEEFVIPIEERGLEAYESGWQKAIELGIFNSWTAKMREALGRLNSELYPPLNETGFQLRSSGQVSLPALIDGLRRSKDGRSEPYLVPVAKVKTEDVDAAPKSAPAKDAAGADEAKSEANGDKAEEEAAEEESPPAKSKRKPARPKRKGAKR